MNAGSELPDGAIESAARQAALAALPPLPEFRAESVRLERGGTVLVIGEAQRAVKLGTELSADFDVFVFAKGAREPAPRPARLHVFDLPLAAIEGHFGCFRAQVAVADGQRRLDHLSGKPDGTFDLVVDVGDRPLLRRTVPPPGYFLAADDATVPALVSRIRALPVAIDKPRHVRFEAALCVHAGAGVAGCDRCLSVCPAQALSSLGDRIAVDFNVCQGCATCVATCPTGALAHAALPLAATLARLRTLLDAHRAAGGRTARLLVHHPDDTTAAGDENWLPLALPAVALFGLEHMLAALAWGAVEVAIAVRGATAESEATLAAQADLVHCLLDLESEARIRISADATPPAPRALEPLVGRIAADLPADDKRVAMFAALDHLLANAARRTTQTPIELPQGAPLGAVEVDASACTLCLACANLCPTQSLVGRETETVQLGFIEQRCVQCGLCERGCPERAIRLRPRLLNDALARRRARVLAADAPARCIECGTPFMSRRMLEAGIDKVRHLPQFAGDGARRLRMCPECRQRATLLDASGLGGEV